MRVALFLFSQAHDQSVLLMLDDTFPRYLDSPEFEEYVLSVSDQLKDNKKRRKSKPRFHFTRTKRLDRRSRSTAGLTPRGTAFREQFQGTSFAPLSPPP